MKETTLMIKNMVCHRCELTVKNILEKLEITPKSITLGTIEIEKPLDNETREKLRQELQAVGFELISTRSQSIVEGIKHALIEYMDPSLQKKVKLSSFLSDRLNYDYSYISDLFSAVEGKTIEQYFIAQRIEKVKELMLYDQLNLTQISYETGFSSINHLSSQFKKLTGMTPSQFKKIASNSRKAIDKI